MRHSQAAHNDGQQNQKQRKRMIERHRRPSAAAVDLRRSSIGPRANRPRRKRPYRIHSTSRPKPAQDGQPRPDVARTVEGRREARDALRPPRRAAPTCCPRAAAASASTRTRDRPPPREPSRACRRRNRACGRAGERQGRAVFRGDFDLIDGRVLVHRRDGSIPRCLR